MEFEILELKKKPFTEKCKTNETNETSQMNIGRCCSTYYAIGKQRHVTVDKPILSP